MKAVLVARGLVLLLALAACSDGAPSAAPSTAAARSETPSASTTVEPTPSASEAATAPPTEEPIAAEPPPLALEEVVSGLSEPINITATPDGWLHVSERGGRVIAVAPENGATQVSLDLTDRVGSGRQEQGLLGLAFHPDPTGENLRGFVHYTDRNGDTVVSEMLVTDFALPLRLDPGTERVLLTVDQPYANHNGGQLAFGPDGYLYLGLGDGGSGGDPHGNGQNPDTLLGKLLRIDVNGDGRYAIPPDNPFADRGGAPEVLLTGLRNPWRFSFDRSTGLLWIGDVGQNAAEEIDRVDPVADAGVNLGWNVMEASRCYVASNCSTRGLTLPVVEYGRDAGCSVTGGYVYRGDAIPRLRGWYLFSDYCSGLLFGVRSDIEGVVGPRVLLETGLNVSTFGEGPEGELYVADIGGGGIYRIVAGD